MIARIFLFYFLIAGTVAIMYRYAYPLLLKKWEVHKEKKLIEKYLRRREKDD